MFTTQCKFCGRYFKADEIDDAIRSGSKVITCRYCGNVNEFSISFQKNVEAGFGALSSAKFDEAIERLSRATEEKSPLFDSFLGLALAQSEVQTIFSDDDLEGYPELIFHSCLHVEFSENRNFLSAKEAARSLPDDVRGSKNRLLDKYAEQIDGFRAAYNRIAARHEEYGAFVAYEDEGADADAGFEKAMTVYNAIPSEVKNVFMPDVDRYGDLNEYEAAILYALEHSKCMVVIADNNVNSRLRSVYMRYYNAHKKDASRICFICIGDKQNARIAGRRVAEFDFDSEKKGYMEFILSWNGVSVREGALDEEEDEVPEEMPFSPEPAEKTPDAPVPAGDNYEFGTYPQKRVTDKRIISYFESGGVPDFDNALDWTPLCTDRSGETYAWMKDDVFEGKKYRAVYFYYERDPFVAHDGSGTSVYQQTINGYGTQTVYCFEFSPIVWRVIGTKQYTVELVTDVALDCREFSDSDGEISWEDSSLRLWLNDEFAYTAFTEAGREYILRPSDSDDIVFLMDIDRNRDEIFDGRHSIRCSDYYMCMGGRCNGRDIGGYWVSAPPAYDYGVATVIMPGRVNSKNLAGADATAMAVLPKISIRK